ncbi:MAG: hypothetical protein ABIP55_16095 [Tepidisphaeraceae bacterium]
MSPLTKMFIVILVLLSLITTSATIVYVNKEDQMRTASKSIAAERDAAKQSAQTLQDQIAAVQANLSAEQQRANDQSTRATADQVKAQADISKLNVELAQSASKSAAQQLDLSRMTEALNATQASATALQQEVARLRGSNDTLVQQGSDLNGRVADLTNKLEVTERERRHLAEQVTQVSSEVGRLGKVIAGANLNPQQQQTAVNRSGQPNINGVVREVRTIAGNQYATISIGAADSVQRNMEFNVIDRASNKFLGTLVVDTVEPNESTGRLFGPGVAQVKPGIEVRSQL